MSFNVIDKKYHGYIYKISNINNKKIYIGQTRRNINIRWNEHILHSKNEKKSNTVLYKAMKKYDIDSLIHR